MLKAKSIAGKQILTRDGAEKVASVKDLVVSRDYTHVTAVLVDGGGLFSQAKVIPIDKVVSFGHDVVVITNKDAVVEADQAPEIKDSLDNKDKLIRKKVYTESGDMQARVSDVYIEPEGGKITGFELTGPLFKSVPDGAAFLPAEDVISIGPDAVMIKTDALSRIVARVTGTTETDTAGS